MTLQHSLLLTLVLQNSTTPAPGQLGPARGLLASSLDQSLEQRYIRRNRRARRAFWRPRAD